MLATLALGVVLTVVDFQFLSVTDAFFANSADGSFQVFYGTYRLVLTILAIFIQTVITPQLTTRYNLKEIFVFFPFVMTVSSLLLWIPGLPAAAAARGLFRTLRGSVDEPVQKMFLALVPEERRGRVSMFMDSYLFAGGALMGCLLVGGVIVAGSALNVAGYESVYLVCALAASVFAIFAMFKVRSTYDKSMLNWRLKRRQRSASVISKLDF
jgi:MFS family permease